jgi:hypothetical protein
MSSPPILTIIARNIDAESMHEFVLKFVKISLAIFYASEKKKKPKEKVLPLYNNKAPISASSLSPNDIENEIISA